MLLRIISPAAVLLLSLAIALPAGAAVVGEGVSGVRCTESGDVKVPKKLEFMQSMMTDSFTGYGRVALGVDVEYAETTDVNRGQVVASVILIKSDGTEIKLGKLKAKMRSGQAERLKLVNVEVEKGDLLHWKIKTKGLPALLAEREECLELAFFAVVADEEFSE